MRHDRGYEVLEACHAGEALRHMEAGEGVALLRTAARLAAFGS